MIFFLKFIFIISFLFIYVLAVILLKPMRLHVKRPYSTAALKISFLAYLAVFLLFTYQFLFYKGGLVFYLEDPENPKAVFHFSLILLASLVPNIGILLRRRFKKRVVYNNAMSFVNLVFIAYLWFLIHKTQ